MNLFHSPTLTELSALIAHCNNYNKKFLILVEHDGEVLIEADSEKTKRVLRKYRFYVPDLRGKNYLGITAATNLKYINQLYKNLVFCWEENMKGAIDHDKISRIQKLSLWLEMKNFSTTLVDDLLYTLFKNDPSGQHTIA